MPRSLLLLACLVITLGSLPLEGRAQNDPAASLRFSTYLGGRSDDAGMTVAMDADGNVYVAGHTASADFPTTNTARPFRSGLVGLDVYVAKLSPDGALVYATYLGGTGDETATALAVDTQGRVYLAGGTTSSDFPTTAGALNGFRGGGLLQSDGFLVRLSADGATIQYATYLGGTGDDAVNALALDARGRVYLTGSTASDDFPTTAGAFQTARAGGLALGTDAFVVRLRPDGAALTLDYAGYVGGSFDETGAALAVDVQGRAYLAGFTNSPDFPTRNPIQAAFAGPLRDFEGDAFVVRLSEDGAALDFATYLGGMRNDQAAALALDAGGHVHVAGWTRSPDFPTTAGAYQDTRRGPEDAFLVKLDPDAGTMRYATYLGGGGTDQAFSLAIDAAGQPVVGGTTDSEDFPLRAAAQDRFAGGEADAFVAHLDAVGSGLIFSTYLGGSDAETLSSLAVNGAGDVCATGGTRSNNYLTAAGPALLGSPDDAFVTCLGEAASGVPVEEAPLDLPQRFALYPNYPNPFNPTTTIRFDVQNQRRVRLTVYDVAGRKLATLVDGDYAPGRYTVTVDARAWASGVYFYRIEAGDYQETKKMVFVK
jgi:hypothetical protein